MRLIILPSIMSIEAFHYLLKEGRFEEGADRQELESNPGLKWLNLNCNRAAFIDLEIL